MPATKIFSDIFNLSEYNSNQEKMMEIIQNRSERFLRLRDVMDMTTLCRSSIYNLIKAGDFPKNVTVMGKRKAWLESEIEDWMMEKIEQSEQ
ncbi:AlpA family transcriptional regulator [uncultured Shewanella sp.]|uniref:helix-turn-helix transcriptional regulator n=1 Tax=uncultured Shewanella sp. TaxID=173975 RepID=UPI00262D4EEB|nr:AlpA family phage regulatory protein [uncultured Shewanella sp.]